MLSSNSQITYCCKLWLHTKQLCFETCLIDFLFRVSREELYARVGSRISADKRDSFCCCMLELEMISFTVEKLSLSRLELAPNICDSDITKVKITHKEFMIND